MQDAVIISTARTPIAKAFRGAFNDLKSPSMAAVAIRAAVARAGIEAAEIEDLEDELLDAATAEAVEREG